jgi:tetratricopeptide (TPR) repeat protein
MTGLTPETVALAAEFFDLRRRFEVGEYTDVLADASRAIARIGSAAVTDDPLFADLLALLQDLAGLAALETGRSQEALELVQAAVAHWRHSRAPEPLARSLLNRALVLESLGRLAQAQDDYLDVERIVHAASDVPGDLLTLALSRLADLRSQRREERAADDLARVVLVQGPAGSDPESLNDLGHAASNAGDHKLAISYYELALAGVSATQHRRLWGVIMNNLALAYAAVGRRQEAVTKLCAAITAHTATFAHDQLAGDLFNLASIAIRDGDDTAAANHLKEAWESVQRGTVRSTLTLRILQTLAFTRLTQKDYARARAACNRGLEIYDEMRPDFARAEPEHRGAVRVLRQLVEILLHLALEENWMDELVATLDRGKARLWIDELRPRPGDIHPNIDAMPVQATGFLRRLQRAVGADVVVLILFAGEYSLFSVRIYNGNIRVHRRNIPASDLPEMVDEVRYELLSSSDHESHSEAELLAERLFGDDSLPERPRAFIVMPDGPLWGVPFDALPVPAWRSEAVVQRCPVSVCASIQVLESLRSREDRGSGRWHPLLIGDPGVGAPIPGTLRQLETIETVFAERRIDCVRLRGVAATVTNVLRHIESATHVHIAAHAVGSTEDEVPHVLLADDSGGSGMLRIDDVESLQLSADLVFLASCSTTLGVESLGEGMMSLARSFLFAGARCVIGALWPIPDQEMVLLVEIFYRQLTRGATVLQALHHALLEMKNAGASARTWSGLQLIGDGDSRSIGLRTR